MQVYFFFVCLLFAHVCFADTVIWRGLVDSNGDSTSVVKLNLGDKYQIKVYGIMNLGKWWQQGKPLIEDACFEFNAESAPKPTTSFKNSMNISVCDGKYHPDHIYQSNPFVAAQSGIHFWIYDTDYSDNTGGLQVEVIRLSP